MANNVANNLNSGLSTSEFANIAISSTFGAGSFSIATLTRQAFLA